MLEQKGLVTRTRMEQDERNVCIAITDKGVELRKQGVQVPEKMQGCLTIDSEDAKCLYQILHKIMKDL